MAALEHHFAGSALKADADYVFAHPERGTRLDSEWYAGEFRSALAAAGITDYVRPFHDARHGALTNHFPPVEYSNKRRRTQRHRRFCTLKQCRKN